MRLLVSLLSGLKTCMHDESSVHVYGEFRRNRLVRPTAIAGVRGVLSSGENNTVIWFHMEHYMLAHGAPMDVKCEAAGTPSP